MRRGDMHRLDLDLGAHLQRHGHLSGGDDVELCPVRVRNGRVQDHLHDGF
jgi:hypothetical protein